VIEQPEAITLGLRAADQLIVRRAILREREQVRSQQRGHLERSARTPRLAELDPEQTALIIEIAHDAIGHLRSAQTEQECSHHRDRRFVALVRSANAQIDELACLVDPQLLLAAVALPGRLHALDRVRADPARFTHHAPNDFTA